MTSRRAFAVCGLMSLALSGAAVDARAATSSLTTGTVTSITAGTVYTYGDTTFDFTACSVACDSLDLLGVSNGRAGTEIEVEEASTTPSYIFTAGAASQSLNFQLTVGTKTGSHGISSVTNIVNGTDAGVTSNDSKVTSVLSSFINTGKVAQGSGSFTSQLNATPAIAASWPVQTTAFSLTDTLNEAACNGCSLKLTNIALLFNPAPEPASIALFATGLFGLARARRRLSRQPPQTSE